MNETENVLENHSIEPSYDDRPSRPPQRPILASTRHHPSSGLVGLPQDDDAETNSNPHRPTSWGDGHDLLRSETAPSTAVVGHHGAASIPPTRRRPGLPSQFEALEPTVRLIKGEARTELTDVDRLHQPGAFEIRRRAAGSIPLWARIQRQASRVLGSRSFDLDIPPAGSVSDVDAVLAGVNDTPSPSPPNEHEVSKNDNDKIVQYRRWAIVIVVLSAIAIGVGVGVGNRSSGSSESFTASSPNVSSTSQPCDFVEQSPPDFIQQCQCSPKVQVISPEISGNYTALVESSVLVSHKNYNDSIDSCSPVNLALLWLAEKRSMSSAPLDSFRLRNRFVLAILFIAWGGRSWTHNSGWLSSQNECSWYGITCRGQNMTGISLTDNGLASGSTVPSELFLLTDLESLFLANNGLMGSFPTELSSLRNLADLCLAGNSLRGVFPFSAMASLTKLRVFDISGNDVSGSLPSTIGQLSSLENFNAPNNLISGSIPSELALLANLISFNVTNSALVGTLPTQIGQLSKLELLNIQGHLRGTIPTEVGLLGSLRHLGFVGDNLSGIIPSQIGALSKLVSLFLDNNVLTGTIPSFLAKCTDLSWLSLSDNELTGPIPSVLLSIPNLKLLDVSRNRLNGSIPEQLFQNTHLEILILSGNGITGTFPTTVEANSPLVCMDVSFNNLKGTIPSSLCNLSNIEEVNVDCSGASAINSGCSCCDCGPADSCSSYTLKAQESITQLLSSNISISCGCC